MDTISKQRLQELAGIKTSTQEEEEKSPQTLNESLTNLGIISPGLLGNPFGKSNSLEETAISEINELEREREQKKSAGRLLHDPEQIKKRQLMKNAVQKFGADRILRHIIAKNSVEWLEEMLKELRF